MAIMRNYGANNANVFGAQMQAGRRESEAEYLQRLLAMLSQIRSQNMNDMLGRDQLALQNLQFEESQRQFDENNALAQERLALDKERQQWYAPRTSIAYTPSTSARAPGSNFLIRRDPNAFIGGS